MRSPFSDSFSYEIPSQYEENRHDDILLAVARDCEDISKLLDVFFGFLRRKTDFFHLLKKETPHIGFLEGKSKSMVINCFDKHKSIYDKEYLAKEKKKKDESDRKISKASYKHENEKTKISSDSSEIYISYIPEHLRKKNEDIKEIIENMLDKKSKCKCIRWPNDSNDKGVYIQLDSFEESECLISKINSGKAERLFPSRENEKVNQEMYAKFAETSVELTEGKENSKDKYLPCSSESSKTSASNSTSSSACSVSSYPSPQNSNLSDENKMKHISTWNGGICEKYIWTQSIIDLTVEVALPCVCRGSDLKISINFHFLEVFCKGSELLKGEFFERVEREECMWNVEDGKKLILFLQKQKESWWECVLKGDPVIDTTKVESVKSINDYDSATQSHIRRIIFDESEKAKGRLTSDQIKKNEILKSVWNAEGSPFKDTPFNPNNVNIQGDFNHIT